METNFIFVDSGKSATTPPVAGVTDMDTTLSGTRQKKWFRALDKLLTSRERDLSSSVKRLYQMDKTALWASGSIVEHRFEPLVSQFKYALNPVTFGVARKYPHQLRFERQKVTYKREVEELILQAGKEDWDGEGALPVVHETISIACALIDHFPFFSHTPDISATPHGEVDFDWCLEDGAMLTISVSSEGEIAYAWLKGTSVMNAKEEWTGESPDYIRCFFERLNSS
jgi:hypothetical protein